MKRAAIYARVSTKNNGQNPETQLVALRDYVQNRGWELTTEYVDHGISGSKDSRPQLDKLMEDARARKTRCCDRRETRSVRPLYSALDPGAGRVSVLRRELHQPKREHRQVHSHGEDGVHGTRCRCRIGTKHHP